MKVMSSDGQLSFDDMNAAPIKIGGGGQRLEDRIKQSKDNLILASEMSHSYYDKPLIVTYSGGKDSDVLLRLAEECLGTDFEVIHSHTTLDAPQTVRHIEKVFKRLNEKGIVTIYRNRFPVEHTIWELILKKKFPPCRNIRYCCAILKETGSQGRLAALGVRAAESHNRQGREAFGIRGGSKKTGLFFV